MKLYALQSHQGEQDFPTFSRGTLVENLAPCARYAHWFSCSIDGYATYVPDIFVENGCLNRDYNPTELQVVQGDEVSLMALYFGWALVRKGEQIGWLPCEILASAIK